MCVVTKLPAQASRLRGGRRCPAGWAVARRGRLQAEGGNHYHHGHGNSHILEHRQGCTAKGCDHAGGQWCHDERTQAQSHYGKARGQAAAVRPPLGCGSDGRDIDQAAADTGDHAVVEVKQVQRLVADCPGGRIAGQQSRLVGRGDSGNHEEAEGHDHAAHQHHGAWPDLVVQAACQNANQTEKQANQGVGHADLRHSPAELFHQRLDEHAECIQQQAAGRATQQPAQQGNPPGEESLILRHS